ncbi:GAF domain-containing protein [Phormidium sp. LEGE 05292]|uniref:GAF domain-containing sensor histidine kinase n=1 Tax=[Phormidium] sp. LEGE 05292 TaxID=767427 RepID=UPI0018828D5E|nr:GAF domain-containing protein [Phormidium sp. LEGE 05292]MBE9228659.1 GAF domain-containing protein [Phormidium sp. LEGE 05292]
MQKVIARIWNASESLGIQSCAPIAVALEEIAKLLNIERCSFFWYLENTKQIKVIHEWVAEKQKLVSGECSSLEIFTGAASALEKIASEASNDLIFIKCGTDAMLASFEAIAQIMGQHKNTRSRRKREEQSCLEKKDFAQLIIPVYRDTTEETFPENSLGLIACYCSHPRHWSAGELDFLQLIAQQLAIAIRQSQIYERSQRQAQREKLINQITSQTRQSLDLENILNSAIAQLLDALEVDRCLVHLVETVSTAKTDVKSNIFLGNNHAELTDTQTKNFWKTAHQIAYRRQHLYEVYREPFPASLTDFDTQGPITQWVIQHRQSVVINDIAQDTRIGEQNEEYQKAAIKSSLVIPVQANNVLHAILYLNQCAYNRYWTKSDLELAEAVANQLAIAIHQACLYAQSRAAMERESLLRVISNQIRRTLDLKTILQTTVKQVHNFLGTDRVAIYQFTEGSLGELLVQELKESCSCNEQEISNNSCFLHNYFYPYQGEVVQIINDVANADISDRHLVFLQQLQVQASLVVPIMKTEEVGEKNAEIKANQIWGLLIVQECSLPRVWQDTEVELLQQISTQLAIAIQQAELYKQSQTAAATAQKKAAALQQALYDLQQTQAQLIQTEKMSSLGQLVAGVAHEINNPVNFIYGNLTYINNYSKDLLKIINLYQKTYPNANSEIQECEEEIDLEFLMQDMPKILSSMKVGTDRIRQIVLSLRNFSRVEQAEMKAADIHEGIESTLLILQNRFKANGKTSQIELIKEYGKIPLVECFAGQLNQVFMNIISNAIDALEQKTGKDNFSPTITIRTELYDNDSIIVRIADNGSGIPAKAKKRLFDAFFTTKPVGKGTGLGLSISYQIVVERHQGRLWCESTLGEGTEFFIKIPLVQST